MHATFYLTPTFTTPDPMPDIKLKEEAWQLCAKLYNKIHNAIEINTLQRLYNVHEKALKRYYRRVGKYPNINIHAA